MFLWVGRFSLDCSDCSGQVLGFGSEIHFLCVYSPFRRLWLWIFREWDVTDLVTWGFILTYDGIHFVLFPAFVFLCLLAMYFLSIVDCSLPCRKASLTDSGRQNLHNTTLTAFLFIDYLWHTHAHTHTHYFYIIAEMSGPCDITRAHLLQHYKNPNPRFWPGNLGEWGTVNITTLLEINL